MSLSAKPLIIFDFDGTIADSFGEFAKIFAAVSPKGELTAEEIEHLRGLSAQQIIKYLKIPLWRIPTMLSKGRQEFTKVLPKVAMFDGLDIVLSTLYAEGCTMHVVSSNGTANIQEFLTTHKIDQYFTQVVGGVGIFSKAAAIKKIIAASGRPPQECLLVGDEARDIDAAKKLGVPIIAVTYGYNNQAVLTAHRPTYMAQRPQDILRALEKLI